MTKTYGHVAKVDDIRGLNSSVGTHCFYWWWRSVILGRYELRAGGGVGYGHEGRNRCIGGK